MSGATRLNFPNFLYLLPVAVAHSFAGGITIHYILPVYLFLLSLGWEEHIRNDSNLYVELDVKP